jgi:hypothetical protein
LRAADPRMAALVDADPGLDSDAEDAIRARLDARGSVEQKALRP